VKDGNRKRCLRQMHFQKREDKIDKCIVYDVTSNASAHYPPNRIRSLRRFEVVDGCGGADAWLASIRRLSPAGLTGEI
jgi:hypothetical protein